jgi:threonine dehydrogenase-like Zn-dependent dehydrogenase
MKAWRFYDFGDMRLDEVPTPEPGPREVLLRVLVVQPSVTEAILAAGRETIGYELVRKRLADAAPIGLFGHEYCAEVVEVGPLVESVRPGDRVVGYSMLPCTDCAFCREGHDDRCRSGPMFGFDMPGCMAEYAVCPENGVVAIPDSLTPYEAAAVQPAAECVASVESAALARGETVAIVGQGAMGVYSMQAARHTLADRVIAIDVRTEPLELAAALGADHCIDASATDAVEAVRELTGGRGADVVIESAGGPPQEGLAGSATVEQSFELVRNCGRVVINSLIPGRTGLDFVAWRSRSVALVFPGLADLRHLATAARMTAQGRLRIDPLISHVVWGIEQTPLAFEITSDKVRFGATGPCQIAVDTAGLEPHPKTMAADAGGAR